MNGEAEVSKGKTEIDYKEKEGQEVDQIVSNI